MLKGLYVAKELMSHKVYNFISSWLFLFFPGGCISFLSASPLVCRHGRMCCAFKKAVLFCQKVIPELWHVSRHALSSVVQFMKKSNAFFQGDF